MWSNNIDGAMQEVRHNYNELARMIYQKEKQIQFLETKAVNLSMFYVASQLMIFLSNSESESQQACRNRKHTWRPFVLSLSIAVAFGLNFGSTIIKYVRAKHEQDINYVDREQNFHQMTTRGHAGDGSSTMCLKIVDVSRPDMFAVYQRCAHLGLTLAALLAITALVLHTCRSAVCFKPDIPAP